MSTIYVCPEFLSYITGLDVLDKTRVSYGTDGLSGVKEDPVWVIILVVGASFVFWVMVRPTCSGCVPVRVLAVYDGQFTT